MEDEKILTPDINIDAPEAAQESPETEEEGEGLHRNHRRRLRRKAYPWPGALDGVRLMELMLFEPMPRCDTNETAKTLLEHCGGFKNFVDGTPEALAAMAELGEHTAVYLEALSLLCRRYEDEMLHGPREFPNLHTARQWLRYATWPTAAPVVTVMLLDNALKVQYLRPSDPERVGLNALAKEVCGAVTTLLPAYVYLAFTHPGGFLAPTRAEYDMVVTLSDACLRSNTYLAEAMVINADGVRFLSESPLFPVGTFLPFRDK